jgi:protein TonB
MPNCILLFAMFASILSAPVGATGQSEDRGSCVGVREAPGGGQELFNGCAETITVFWCVDQPPGICDAYTNRLDEFTATSRHRIPNGYVRRGACLGARAVVTTSGLDYDCPPPARQPPEVPARLANCPTLDGFYPPASRRLGEQGVVEVEISFDASGAVIGVALLASSGFPRLDAASDAFFRQCAVNPARDRDGRAIAGTLPARLRWTLAP